MSAAPARDTPPRRSGRRAGDSGTREAILEAARTRFAEHGYDGATIRGIAADARVDPALVHHFYGTKEKLFIAAMRFPVVPSEVIGQMVGIDRERLGETIVRTVLGVWEREDTRDQATGLLRSAVTNERAATMIRGFVSRTILGAVATHVDAGDAEFRASLVASQIIGLGIARYVIAVEPLASASTDDVAAAVGPTLQRYLTEPVRARSTRRPAAGRTRNRIINMG
jgi:AcrR family transcriptional regulator